jgi:RNA polymerase sigma-70 factor, ECF subfamily
VTPPAATPADALAEALAGDDPPSAEHAAAAARALASAAAAWPDLPADAGFVAFARDRLPELAQLDARLADLLVAHHACAGHPTAVAAIRRMLDALRPPLRRTGADAGMLEELLADLPGDLVAPRAGAAPRLHGFAGRGPLAGWLRVVAVRTLVERRRKAGASPEDDDAAVADAATPEIDPELDLLRRTYAAEFRAAFAAVVAELDPADRLLLRQHHLDGVGLDALARMHGVHRATAARRLAAAREAIFARVRRRLLGELRVGGDTVDSIIRLVRSELELSLERYL